jgi:parvulin-like peptidyl-prolyl isomerase
VPRVKQIAIVTLVVAALVTLAACKSNGGSGSTDTAVVATVNGKSITLREVDAILSQQAKNQQTDISKLSPLELAAGRLQVLDGLIQQEALFQRAEKENLRPTEDEVTQAINSQKQQARMTEEEYQTMLRETKQTEADLREVARKTIAIQKLQEKSSGNISISDREVEDFYNNNKERFVNARGVSLSAIVVDPADNGIVDATGKPVAGDAKSDAEAAEKINVVYQQLKSPGVDFAAVARDKSEDASNLRGGDIGFFTEDQLRQGGFPQDLIAKLFNPATQVGEITAPVRSANGRWYIFKLAARQLQNENLTIDSPGVRDQIKEALINQRRSLMNDALMRVALADAKVVNNLAQDMMTNPSNLSSLRPAGAGTPAPAASATPAATASASAPAAAASPSVRPTTSPAARANATPAPRPAAGGNSNR